MKVTKDTKLLILDWGIGGIGTLQKLRRRKPDLDILYVSDSGQEPYGKQAPLKLSKRLKKIVAFAQDEGATHVIVACNAASTVLISTAFAIPSLGVISEGLIEIASRPLQHVGIIGGERTIASCAWSSPLEVQHFRVSTRVAQPLSALIESGQHRHPSSKPVFASVLSGLEEVDLLVLACTHYVAAAELISELLPGVELYDPVDACVDFALQNWGLSRGQGRTSFFCSGGIDAMISSAKLAYDYSVPSDACSSFDI